jgi:hypothetical protein
MPLRFGDRGRTESSNGQIDSSNQSTSINQSIKANNARLPNVKIAFLKHETVENKNLSSPIENGLVLEIATPAIHPVIESNMNLGSNPMLRYNIALNIVREAFKIDKLPIIKIFQIMNEDMKPVSPLSEMHNVLIAASNEFAAQLAVWDADKVTPESATVKLACEKLLTLWERSSNSELNETSTGRLPEWDELLVKPTPGVIGHSTAAMVWTKEKVVIKMVFRNKFIARVARAALIRWSIVTQETVSGNPVLKKLVEKFNSLVPAVAEPGWTINRNQKSTSSKPNKQTEAVIKEINELANSQSTIKVHPSAFAHSVTTESIACFPLHERFASLELANFRNEVAMNMMGGSELDKLMADVGIVSGSECSVTKRVSMNPNSTKVYVIIPESKVQILLAALQKDPICTVYGTVMDFNTKKSISVNLLNGLQAASVDNESKPAQQPADSDVTMDNGDSSNIRAQQSLMQSNASTPLSYSLIVKYGAKLQFEAASKKLKQHTNNNTRETAQSITQSDTVRERPDTNNHNPRKRAKKSSEDNETSIQHELASLRDEFNKQREQLNQATTLIAKLQADLQKASSHSVSRASEASVPVTAANELSEDVNRANVRACVHETLNGSAFLDYIATLVNNLVQVVPAAERPRKVSKQPEQSLSTPINNSNGTAQQPHNSSAMNQCP